MRTRTYSRADKAASTMPQGLVHHREGEPFSYLTSEPVQWLIEQPEILEMIYQRFYDKEVIKFDPETKTWGGNPIPDDAKIEETKATIKPRKNTAGELMAESVLLPILREKGPLRSSQFHEASGLGNGTFYRYLDALKRSGSIECAKTGWILSKSAHSKIPYI